MTSEVTPQESTYRFFFDGRNALGVRTFEAAFLRGLDFALRFGVRFLVPRRGR